MIKSFIKSNYSIFRIVLMALIGVIFLFNFISLFGNYSDSASTNFGITVSFVVFNGLLAILLYCILSNKDQYTQFLGFVLLAYYVISTLLNLDSPFYSFYDGAHGTVVARAVFQIFQLLAFLSFVVIAIIEKINRTELKIGKISILDILALAYLFFSLMVFIMEMCVYGVFDYKWTSFMSSFVNRLFMPCLIVLGYYMFQIKFLDAPQDEEYVPFEAKEEEKQEPQD